MSNNDPRSLLDRLLGVCLTLLMGAAAIHIAVRLVEAVWTALLVILGVGAFVGLAWVFVRGRSQGW